MAKFECNCYSDDYLEVEDYPNHFIEGGRMDEKVDLYIGSVDGCLPDESHGTRLNRDAVEELRDHLTKVLEAWV